MDSSKVAEKIPTPQPYVEYARAVRLGTKRMPEPAILFRISEWERNFLLNLVYDDAIFDFFDSVKEMSWEQIRRIRDLANAQDEYEQLENAFIRAKQRRNIALKNYRELFKENDQQQE